MLGRPDPPTVAVARPAHHLAHSLGLLVQSPSWAVRGLCALGALAVAGSGGIHLYLYETGYNIIPTIGPLFLALAVSAFAIGAALVIVPTLLTAVAGMLLALGTIGGFLLTVYVGLFGFTDTFSAPYATVALGDEIGAACVLLIACALCAAPLGKARSRRA